MGGLFVFPMTMVIAEVFIAAGDPSSVLPRLPQSLLDVPDKRLSAVNVAGSHPIAKRER